MLGAEGVYMSVSLALARLAHTSMVVFAVQMITDPTHYRVKTLPSKQGTVQSCDQ